MSHISEIVGLVKKAQDLATKYGYKNILQPGFIKELIIAEILVHEVHKTKHEPDAYDPADRRIAYEYLSCFEKGTFQLDRMFKAPLEKRNKSLGRISRNSKVYCAVFSEKNPLDVVVIYEIEIPVFLTEAERQLDSSSNDISHIGMTIRWAKENGKQVYPKK